jgi:hypothetical protein
MKKQNLDPDLEQALRHGEVVANALSLMFKQLNTPNDMEYHFDIDLAIEKMNEAKDENEPKMSRALLSEQTGISYRTLINWQQGNLPGAFLQASKILAMSGMKFEELFKLKNQEL